MMPTLKIAGSLVRNARFFALTCLVSSRWFSCGVAVSMWEAAKPLLFEGFQGSCPVVLRGRRGTLWHSNLFDNVSKMSKLEEVSYEMLIFLHPRVSSRVAGCPVASLCLWGKLENLSFSKVFKEVVMSFCVAGVALCDISICLITCGKCENWRKSRTKCSFSCLQFLVFLWHRRVYGGSWKSSPWLMFPSSRGHCKIMIIVPSELLWKQCSEPVAGRSSLRLWVSWNCFAHPCPEPMMQQLHQSANSIQTLSSTGSMTRSLKMSGWHWEIAQWRAFLMECFVLGVLMEDGCFFSGWIVMLAQCRVCNAYCNVSII